MFTPLLPAIVSIRWWFRSRAALQVEILALRHQLSVLKRSQRGRLRLSSADRLLWVWLCRFWANWRAALLIVKPETVIAWHRKGFRIYWTWKSRQAAPGRPTVPREIRDLIRKLSLANPLWGAPRIHGELLKLGIELSQATVAKYMQRHHKPRLVKQLVRSCDRWMFSIDAIPASASLTSAETATVLTHHHLCAPERN
jgi:hypothetical protein